MGEKVDFFELHLDVRRYLTSARRFEFSMAERALFLELCFFQWLEGDLPGDVNKIANLVAQPLDVVAPIWTAVRPHFHQIKGGRLQCAEIEELREQKIEKRRRRVNAGRKGGQRKAENSSIARTLLDGCYKQPTGSLSDSYSFSSNSATKPSNDEQITDLKNRPEVGKGGPGEKGETHGEAKSWQTGSNARATAAEDAPELVEQIKHLFARLHSQHPRGHNPRPEAAAVEFYNRARDKGIDFAAEMVSQHRSKWLPAWFADRGIPDLDRWIRDYDPEADLKPWHGPVSVPMFDRAAAPVKTETEARKVNGSAQH